MVSSSVNIIAIKLMANVNRLIKVQVVVNEFAYCISVALLKCPTV
jgi:hypothetical protein